jgi:hypothetical protein
VRLKFAGVVAHSVVAVLASAAWIICAHGYARLLLPGIELVARPLAEHAGWRIGHPRLVAVGPRREAAIELRAIVAGPVGMKLTVARVTLDGLLQEPLLLTALCALWPLRGPREALARFALAAAVLYLVASAEQGVALLGEAATVAAELRGAAGEVPWQQRWTGFTEAGGSLALAAASALFVIAAARALSSQRACNAR